MYLQSNDNYGIMGVTKSFKSHLMATIQIRIDEETKKSVQVVLKELGLDMSAAIKLFLKQVVIRNGLPFKVNTENGLTLEQEAELLKASADAKKGIGVSGPFETMEEFINYLELDED